MCPIDFVDDIMHINEWAGLNVKMLKCSHISSQSCIYVNIQTEGCESQCPQLHGIKLLELINMHSGWGLMLFCNLKFVSAISD